MSQSLFSLSLHQYMWTDGCMSCDASTTALMIQFTDALIRYLGERSLEKELTDFDIRMAVILQIRSWYAQEFDYIF